MICSTICSTSSWTIIGTSWYFVTVTTSGTEGVSAVCGRSCLSAAACSFWPVARLLLAISTVRPLSVHGLEA
eukprot:13434893-Heterocapsa_arctica.AAC.1